ncbi:MAG: cobalt-precorrin-6A reductase [Rhodospirillaceae bacterium]|nr:cobalt-precorrin-6A reductase [Rhodospirillaceae bacterium]|tara:strand:+ start:330 stop:1076 length:747 start_codon:yes stop_codon:yes gene_type:complete
MNRKSILLLGGTSEAVGLADEIQNIPNVSVVYSLAGRTRNPKLPNCEVRFGGFGGIDGLVSFMKENDISFLVNATHPYAAQMSLNASEAAKKTGTPYYRFLRQPWFEPKDACWIHVESLDKAAEKIGGTFERVFLSSGLNGIAAFAPLNDVWFLVRSIEDPEEPMPLRNYTHIKDRGPFNFEAECALLRDNKIEALVSKNSGGDATSAKLEAARSLSVPVIMVDRPNDQHQDTFVDSMTLVEQIRNTI